MPLIIQTLTSIKSLHRLWTAYSFESSTVFCIRFRTFSVSANCSMYFFWNLSQHSKFKKKTMSVRFLKSSSGFQEKRFKMITCDILCNVTVAFCREFLVADSFSHTSTNNGTLCWLYYQNFDTPASTPANTKGSTDGSTEGDAGGIRWGRGVQG